MVVTLWLVVFGLVMEMLMGMGVGISDEVGEMNLKSTRSRAGEVKRRVMLMK